MSGLTDWLVWSAGIICFVEMSERGLASFEIIGQKNPAFQILELESFSSVLAHFRCRYRPFNKTTMTE